METHFLLQHAFLVCSSLLFFLLGMERKIVGRRTAFTQPSVLSCLFSLRVSFHFRFVDATSRPGAPPIVLILISECSELIQTGTGIFLARKILTFCVRFIGIKLLNYLSHYLLLFIYLFMCNFEYYCAIHTYGNKACE